MKKILITILFFTGFAVLFAQPKDGIYEVKVGDTIAVTTATGIKLPTSFGNQAENFAVFRVTGLKPGTKYMATFTYDGGTGIYYGMCWVNGNPLLPDWWSFVGIGSGTGSGKLMPGYEMYHLFIIDPKSTKDAIYLVVRSDKPWKINFSVAPAKPGVDRNTKNSYDYSTVDDLTNEGKVTYLLDKD